MIFHALFKRFIHAVRSSTSLSLAAVFGVAVFGLFLAGCQKEAFHSSSANSGAIGNRRLIPIQSMEFSKVKLAPLACMNPADCPEAIGELVQITSMGLETCTVSLVAPTVVLTASHCVPWESVGPHRSISKNCWIRWPAALGQPAQTIACTAVIKASEFTPNPLGRVRVDYAYLKLAAPSARRPLPLRADIVRRPDEETAAPVSSVIVYGISPRLNPHRIMRLDCSRDDLIELKTRPLSQVGAMIFPSCPVEHGFSGGPILDPVTSQIIGVTSFIETLPNRVGRHRIIAVGTRHQSL